MTTFLASLGVAAVPPAFIWAQTPTGSPDLAPLAQWGVAGVLLAFILWLYMDERKEHRALREKVLTDVLPALIANNEQMKETAAATIMIHQLAGRPNVDPVAFSEWLRTMRELRDRLDRER